MGCGLCVENCTLGIRKMKIVEHPSYILDVPEDQGVGAGFDLDVERAIAKVEAATEKKKSS